MLLFPPKSLLKLLKRVFFGGWGQGMREEKAIAVSEKSERQPGVD
jgi:hypothetical protein